MYWHKLKGKPKHPRFLVTAFLLTVLFCVAFQAATAAESRQPLPRPEGKVILTVKGAIDNTNVDGAAKFDWAMLKSLPQVTLTTHSSVNEGVHSYTGFLMRDLLERVGAHGSTVIATALNYYVVEIPIKDFYRFDVIVAYKMDGESLVRSKKGPLWIVYPRDRHEVLQDIRYDYRWVWQLVRLKVK